MKAFKENLIILIPLVLMALSTVINLLFYFNITSKIFVQYAFIAVILCGVAINITILKAQNNNSEKAQLKKRSVFTIVMSILISISWIISYGLASFMK